MAKRTELSPRLTYWTAPHPRWQPNPEWPEDVGCALYVADDVLALVDPLVRDDLNPNAWDWLDEAAAAEKLPVAVLLTAPWHERSTRAAVERYDARVWIAERGRERVNDLPQLGTLPSGVVAFEPRGIDEGQVALYLEKERSLVVAEFFLGTPSGLQLMPSPATDDVDAFVDSITELERLPIDRVLVAHGTPVLGQGREAIAAAVRRYRRP